MNYNKNHRPGNVGLVLQNQDPSNIVFAPNYWQWFSHHQNHGTLPDEIKRCNSQLDMIKYLGLDVFSRNVYCNQSEYWFGGLCEEYFDDIEVETSSSSDLKDIITDKLYRSGYGSLNEQLRYVFNESTVVQKKFLITDYKDQSGLLEHFVASRKWRFNKNKFDSINKAVGEAGVVVAGEFFSPLKMLHLAMDPIHTVYFLLEEPVQAKVIMDLHEKAQLDLVRQCVSSGVRVIMAMDNLDTMFHTPDFVETCSASFYEKASSICHEYGAKFFIHACGNQKENLSLISSYGVDGLEGVAFPPFGNVGLDEALQITPGNFIITGGISAVETRDLKSKQEVFDYVGKLFQKIRPYKNRFMFSASCNTPIDTKWETIKNFRDAWLEFRNI